MSDKVRWGILGTAIIAIEDVIPAMQKSEYCQIHGIASRVLTKAQDVAMQFGIPKAYGTYDELLDDDDIDAIYIPLPNHMHVPWSIKALEAGKHILCEKPIGLNAQEAKKLLEQSRKYPTLKIMEAFMYRHHPQWQKARELVKNGKIGELKTIQSSFSYINDDPYHICNKSEMGGGGLLDIGCYNISLSRFIFDSEPLRVCSKIEYHSEFKVDHIAAGILEFNGGSSSFFCSLQIPSYQNVNIFGSEGRIEINMPFNPLPDKPCKIRHEYDGHTEEINIKACDQYRIQGDLFSQAILNDTAVPTPLEDAMANMMVIDKLIESNKSGKWTNI
jgi:predicted dehydrogenase